MAAPLLETARLRLRLFTPEDATALGHIAGAACGKRDRAHAVLSPGEAQTRGRHLVHRFLEQWDAYGFGVWAVVDKAHDTLRGYCGLQYVPGTAEVELLYLLDPSVWGRGMATEAATASVRYGQEVVGLRRIVARVAASNRASRRVLEKVGLVCERVSAAGAQDIACYATPAGYLVNPAGELLLCDASGGQRYTMRRDSGRRQRR